MKRSSYSEQLKDPRWQKIRLEVMERDGWRCVSCSDSKTTLNVHHLNYDRGAAPWEYDLSNFVTMCEGCHRSVEESIRAIRMNLPFMEHEERCAFAWLSNGAVLFDPSQRPTKRVALSEKDKKLAVAWVASRLSAVVTETAEHISATELSFEEIGNAILARLKPVESEKPPIASVSATKPVADIRSVAAIWKTAICQVHARGYPMLERALSLSSPLRVTEDADAGRVLEIDILDDSEGVLARTIGISQGILTDVFGILGHKFDRVSCVERDACVGAA